jgi:hypothetical protein
LDRPSPAGISQQLKFMCKTSDLFSRRLPHEPASLAFLDLAHGVVVFPASTLPSQGRLAAHEAHS